MKDINEWFPEHEEEGDELKELCDLLAYDRFGYGVERTFPPPAKKYPFMSLIENWDPKLAIEIRDRWNDWRAEKSAFPLVAITGALNAGKSSLSKQFLKENKRVLTGIDSNHGSHRFTFWLPSNWNKESFFRKMRNSNDPFFAPEAFEELSLDPKEAKRQQNAQGCLDRPLYAFDEYLNALGVALVDCPDIESGKKGLQCIDPDRKIALSRLAPLCKNVVFVCQHGAENKDICHEILDIFSRKTVKVLAVNKARNDRVEDIVKSIQGSGLLQGVDHLYLAYRFDLNNYEDFVVPEIEEYLQSKIPNYGEGEPIFFRCRIDQSNEPVRSHWIEDLFSNLQEIEGVDQSAVPLDFLKAVENITLKSWVVTTKAKNKKFKEIREELNTTIENNIKKHENISKGNKYEIFFPTPATYEAFTESVERTMPRDIAKLIYARNGIKKGGKRILNNLSNASKLIRWRQGAAMNPKKEESNGLKEQTKLKMNSEDGVFALLSSGELESWAKKMNLPPLNGKKSINDISDLYNIKFPDSQKSDKDWDKETQEMWDSITPLKRMKIYSSAIILGTALVVSIFDGGLTTTIVVAAGGASTSVLAASVLYQSIPTDKKNALQNKMFDMRRKVFKEAVFEHLGFTGEKPSSYLQKVGLYAYDNGSINRCLSNIGKSIKQLKKIQT